MLRLFRGIYGHGPLHLLATAASLALAAFAFMQIFDSTQPWSVVIWFVGSIVGHDLILLPLYSILGRIAGSALGTDRETRPGRVAAINYVRFPFLGAGLMLLVFFPLILGLSESRYRNASGQDIGVYFGRWLLLSAALFVLSAVLYALRLRRAAASTAA